MHLDLRVGHLGLHFHLIPHDEYSLSQCGKRLVNDEY